mmetsp:Transcript_46250/g.132420  ORF Transcript_46250/g.132420 Transcript_46250/m.132420 type:complete len:201 (-) Transcript_46250:554-1156(-)
MPLPPPRRQASLRWALGTARLVSASATPCSLGPPVPLRGRREAPAGAARRRANCRRPISWDRWRRRSTSLLRPTDPCPAGPRRTAPRICEHPRPSPRPAGPVPRPLRAFPPPMWAMCSTSRTGCRHRRTSRTCLWPPASRTSTSSTATTRPRRPAGAGVLRKAPPAAAAQPRPRRSLGPPWSSSRSAAAGPRAASSAPPS